ncbi:GntR family transcriptional regulator [Pseudoroseicyclus sp. CXY001]|uniref:GntR family transcriptional regulator n=1 Tax=Pseudoroseicyclus sp. CXY001 TaxID=3242492 RepID=UPI003570C10C
MAESADGAGLYAPDSWLKEGRGPRYLQLSRHLAAAIGSGTLEPGAQLPAERELAELAEVSRVTIRKAVAQLAADGLIEQRRGAGSFVRASGGPRLEQSLSTLVSFTENMRARGRAASSVILSRGVHPPSPEESVALGLGPADPVARIARLRSADGVPMALEHSSLPADILPDPARVSTSLYEVLRASGTAPTRAIQRVAAIAISAREAEHLSMPEGAAVLKIDRTGYLATGRPIEFTRGLYRSDIYDFVTELRLDI